MSGSPSWRRRGPEPRVVSRLEARIRADDDAALFRVSREHSFQARSWPERSEDSSERSPSSMSTAARLEQACRTPRHALLASRPLLDCRLIPQPALESRAARESGTPGTVRARARYAGSCGPTRYVVNEFAEPAPRARARSATISALCGNGAPANCTSSSRGPVN
jgi:hypothetical protein